MVQHSSDAETEATESPPVPTEPYFSRSEAARYLGVPVSTIYHWARIRRLPFILTLGGHMRFSQSDLDVVNIRRSRAADPPPRQPTDAARSADRQSDR